MRNVVDAPRKLRRCMHVLREQQLRNRMSRTTTAPLISFADLWHEAGMYKTVMLSFVHFSVTIYGKSD